MSYKNVIPDTSFFLCFLNDIKDISNIKKIINSGRFKFVIGPIVESELKRERNFKLISSDLRKVMKKPLQEFNYGEIVRVFLGFNEIRKGEHEVIAIAIVYHIKGIDFVLIIDEDSSRRIIRNKFKGIETKMTGTVGFIKDCYCKYKVYSKEEAINILSKVRNSKFRISPQIINQLIEIINRGCRNDNSH